MILAIQTSKELQIFSITHNTKNLHKNNILYGDPVFIIQLELCVELCTLVFKRFIFNSTGALIEL